jgi:hypothetical protein
MPSPSKNLLIRSRLLGASRQPQLALFSSLLLAASLSGCGKEMFKSLGEMARLRTELIKEFHEEEITVVVRNSTMLGVTFTNSKLNDQSNLKRMERAQETALFVKGHYAGMDRIERVWVSFVAHETRYLIVNYTRGIDTYLFDKKGSLLSPPAQYGLQPDPKPDDEARANYSPYRNETDVQITRLQLSGDLNHGVALVPNFTLHGDATTADHSMAAPRSVNFTFASYAPEKVFKTDVPFGITADGKMIYSSMAHNSSTTTEGGNEFLTQMIPFPQFLEMTRARKASLKLADKEYRLTDRQLGGLRQMASYAPSTER